MKYLYFTLTIVLSLIYNSNFAQKLVVKKTYYDIYQTKLKAEWQESGNGQKNGYYKEYYSNGQISIDKIYVTLPDYPYWVIATKWKEFDQAGNLIWSTTQNEKWEFQGVQISYQYIGAKTSIQTKAVFELGKLISFEKYNKKGIKVVDFASDSYFKTFTDNGEIYDNLSISKDRTFSGKYYQNDCIVELLNGKINKVYEITPKKENGNWQVIRMKNDTVVSSMNANGKIIKKYYKDSLVFGLINNPTINIDHNQWKKNEFGLDFVDKKYLPIESTLKYSYLLNFYNRDSERFIKKEIWDSVANYLEAIITPEKDIYYYPSGKIKKILFSDTNWEQYDENGTVVNNYQKELKSIYEKNYNYLLSAKTAMLRKYFGYDKYLIELNGYRKNSIDFLKDEHMRYPGFSQEEIGIESFKVAGSNILLMENQRPSSTYTNVSILEASATKSLLEQRKKLFDIILENGIDNQPFLFDNIDQEGGRLYEIKIKEGFKNIFKAYRLLTNELNDSITKITSIEPTNILSKKYKTAENLDLEKDKEIISLLTNEKFTDYGIDNGYIPAEWLAFNNNYFYLAKAHNKLIDTFLEAIKLNSNKLDKKLKDAADSSEIKLILTNLK